MSAIREAMQAWLGQMKWKWDQIDENRIRSFITGVNGQWVWTGAWNDLDTLLVCYSTYSFKVPSDRLPVVAEFLTLVNASLLFGNYELNLDTGQVRFKTSAMVYGAQLSPSMVHDLAFAGFSRVDQYMRSLMGVAFGQLDPRKAIDQAKLPVWATAAGKRALKGQPDGQPVATPNDVN